MTIENEVQPITVELETTVDHKWLAIAKERLSHILEPYPLIFAHFYYPFFYGIYLYQLSIENKMRVDGVDYRSVGNSPFRHPYAFLYRPLVKIVAEAALGITNGSETEVLDTESKAYGSLVE